MKKNLKDRTSKYANDKNVVGIHLPIMLSESVESLNLKEGEVVVDATVNRGGHSKEFAKLIGESGTLIVFDLDKVALREVEQTLSLALSRGEGTEQQAPTTYYIHSNFRNIKSELEKINIKVVDKIFADLGLSSQELDISGRGFTFQKDEPLHMTLNSEINENTLTAKDLLNTLNIQQLTDIFRNYGDDKNSYKIAKYIVEQRENQNRKIETTGELVQIIEEIVPRKPWMKASPSTKIFQALRIAVNDEYDALRDLLKDGFEILKSGGIFSIITFHSGEDRIVKNFFREKISEGKAKEEFKKKKTKNKEIEENRRSRSAILRSITKL